MPQDHNAFSRQSAELTQNWIKGAGAFMDLHAQTALTYLKAQSRGATMMGMPDMSGFLDQIEQPRQRIFASNAEQMSTYVRHAAELAEIQMELSRTVIEQSSAAAETISRSMQQLNEQTQQRMGELRDLAAETQKNVRQMQQAAQEGMYSAQQQAGQMQSSILAATGGQQGGGSPHDRQQSSSGKGGM